jgi:hypothetical protein
VRLDLFQQQAHRRFTLEIDIHHGRIDEGARERVGARTAHLQHESARVRIRAGGHTQRVQAVGVGQDADYDAATLDLAVHDIVLIDLQQTHLDTGAHRPDVIRNQGLYASDQRLCEALEGRWRRGELAVRHRHLTGDDRPHVVAGRADGDRRRPTAAAEERRRDEGH